MYSKNDFTNLLLLYINELYLIQVNEFQYLNYLTSPATI